MTGVLDALRAHAAASPDAIAARGGGQAMTYRSLRDESERVAAILQRHRIDVLAVGADNSPDWIVIDLAAQLAGATLVPLPLFFSADQLQHVVADSGAQVLVLDAMAAQLPAAFGARFSTPLTAALGLWALPRPSRRKLPGGTAKVSYTSGTSGTPKGVCLMQAGLDRVAESLCAATAGIAIDTHLCLLPLATLLENVAGVYAPLLRGATVAVPRLQDVGLRDAASLDTRRLLACIASACPQSIILLPQMLTSLVCAVERGATLAASLRFIAVGGAVVAASVLARAARAGLPVYEGYGLTECGSVVALNTPSARRAGSVGRPLAHVGIRIGAGSEILVAGATMAGYLTGDAPPAADPDAEIATGDIGHLDADGFLYVTGRSKSLFITSFGRNVQPEWVEAALTGSGAIAQAALFGEARPWNVAIVVPASPELGRERIEGAIAAANAQLPAYARIHRWLLADEPFTQRNGMLTPNGRNRRHAIWDRHRDQIDACYDESLTTCARQKSDKEAIA